MSNMIQSARQQVAQLTQAAYEKAAGAGLLPAAHAVNRSMCAAQAEAAERFRIRCFFPWAKLGKERDRAACVHGSLVGAQTAGQNGEQRGFAASVRSDQADPVAVVQGERLRGKEEPFPRVLCQSGGFQ